MLCVKPSVSIAQWRLTLGPDMSCAPLNLRDDLLEQLITWMSRHTVWQSLATLAGPFQDHPAC